MTKSNIVSKLEEKIDKFYLIQAKATEHRIAQVWDYFVSGGFSPILIKGWVTARKYPNPAERQFVDLDLVFSSDEFESAKEFSINKNFGILLDFHDEVRHLDSLGFDDLFKNSEIVEIAGKQVRILCEEDHLRLICVHWLNDGGEYKNKLWDIYHAVNNRKHDFDWEKCLNVVSPKRRRWIICAIGLCHLYLDLNLDDTPIKDEAKKLPKWLIKTVEKEWSNDVRLLPLDQFLNDRKQLWKQIKKRIPPNAIQATIEVDGDFDKYPRIYYQSLDIIKRFTPSYRRIISRFKV